MNLNTIQTQAYKKLSKLKAGALFMAMGTGKTKVALDIIKARQHDFNCLLWLAPASLIHSVPYKEEFNKWADGLNVEVVFKTIESVSISDAQYLEINELARTKEVCCVIDESLTIKNPGSSRTTRMWELRDLFKFRLVLNGTPVTKGLMDLYSQINFISPCILNMTEAQFARNFLQFSYKDKQGRLIRKPWRRWSKPCNENALIEILRPYIFDAQLEIGCQLIKTDNTYYLNKEEVDSYTAVKTEYLKDLPGYEIDFLAMAQHFQNHYTACAAKLKGLENKVNTIKQAGEKVIIFVKFLSEIKKIKAVLGDVPVMNGSSDKTKALRRFEANEAVLIMTYGTGSLGLNLQYCNNVIFFTQTFDYGQKKQALHRVYRTGQTKTVNVCDFWVSVGLDTVICDNIHRKAGTAAHITKLILSKEEAMRL